MLVRKSCGNNRGRCRLSGTTDSWSTQQLKHRTYEQAFNFTKHHQEQPMARLDSSIHSYLINLVKDMILHVYCCC